MPGFDGTGPFGDGRPGRGLGPCGRFDGFLASGGYGRGRGRRFGGGFGYRYRVGAYPVQTNYAYREPIYSYTKEDMLAQKAEIEKQLQWLNEQLSQEDKS
ncbi:MAG: DUF5320 domain-containing protein [Candidatus Cloacimonetes bacterium]|jgi:hypothetical protein|nr:DUF5320 domain-containing protein [Candidatus Cloacimonadota bacterium]MDD2507288.1 DUF5320 domain-containing protein [Candidatus Cloacimonadota bacterium]MDD4560707.1 DUF5320 domain-containing protein [Candidatus Cloacimonadota bacterium]